MKKNIIYLSIGLLSFGASSCKKMLDQEPKNSTYSEVFWDDPRAGTNAVAGNYAMLRNTLSDGIYNTYNRYYMHGDATADIEYAMRGNDGQGNMEVFTGAFGTNYTSAALGNWTNYYKTIAMANIVLKKMSEVPEELLTGYYPDPAAYRKNIYGQALFIRALTYFMLTRIYGDVPLVTEAYDDPIKAPHLPRSPKADVLAQIEKDCNEALTNLSWTYLNSGDRAVTANKGSVYALLAHMYLWRATTSNVQVNTPVMTDVDKAAEAITQIETNGTYTLTDTANYYQTFIGRSSESIFEINKSEDTQEGSSQHIGRWFIDNRYISYLGGTAYFYVKPDFLNTYFGVDAPGPWAWVWNTTTNAWEWKQTTVKVRDSTELRYRKNFDDVKSNYPVCLKYYNVIYRQPGLKLDGYFSNNQNIFRLSDMKLLKAEIALYKDQTATAIEIINGFRKRNNANPAAYVPATATKAVVMTEYIKERAKELYLEGHLFYDLIRTRQCFQLVPWLNQDRFKQEGFYWPVAPQLFKENRFLVQTQYWRGKV